MSSTKSVWSLRAITIFPMEEAKGATNSARHSPTDQRKRLEIQSRPLPRAPVLSGEAHEAGHFIRKPRGSCVFHYDMHGNPNDDKSGYRFGSHRFVPGEYVSIKEHDDVLRTFRVMMVQPLE